MRRSRSGEMGPTTLTRPDLIVCCSARHHGSRGNHAKDDAPGATTVPLRLTQLIYCMRLATL